jgi:hypothetical protein
MVYEDECFDDEELEDEEDFEDEDEPDEDIFEYDFVEEVKRHGNIIEIKISAIDVYSTVLKIPVHDAFKLIRELVKLLNKDEIKELTAELIDAIMK